MSRIYRAIPGFRVVRHSTSMRLPNSSGERNRLLHRQSDTITREAAKQQAILRYERITFAQNPSSGVARDCQRSGGSPAPSAI